jgi:calcium-translocating P-type ATPase
MTFLGIMAIRDDVRPEARRALREIGGAGIQTVMVTGDRKETAVAVAKEAGLLEKEDAMVLTSQELGKLSDARLKELLPRIRVIARALPTDKSRLVAVAQELNLVVGMTGDGVNDAAALKRADVGFAMGSGSEVAKEAGDIVILDDNVFSIRNAVLYGRTIFHSIKKFIRFQLTINVAAVTVSILGPIVGVEKPLDISQMIWTNLMIDSLAAIAFGSEPAMGAYLREKPKRREDPILDREMWSSVIVNGLYICSLSLLFFILPSIRRWFRPGEGDIFFYTGYFTFFIFTCIFNAFNTRTDGIDLLENLSLNKQFITVMSGIAMAQILMTYYGGNILRTAGLSPKEWVLPLVLALTIIPLDLIRKIFLQLKKTGKSTRILS